MKTVRNYMFNHKKQLLILGKCIPIRCTNSHLISVEQDPDPDYETTITIELRKMGDNRPPGYLLNKSTNLMVEYWVVEHNVYPITAFPLIKEYFGEIQ